MIQYIKRKTRLDSKIQCKFTCFLPFCSATTKTVGDTGVTNKI